MKIKNINKKKLLKNLSTSKTKNSANISRLPLEKEEIVNFSLEITEKVKKQIDYLHSLYPGKEWGGFLFYSVIEEKEDFSTLKTEDFYPLDLGVSTFTSYTQTPEFANFLANNPEYLDFNIGIIHTHHTMGAFHSGTDINTVNELAPIYKNILSLVVDTKETYDVKIGKLYKEEFIKNKNITYDLSNKVIDLSKEKEDKIEYKEKIEILNGKIIMPEETSINENFKKIALGLKRNQVHTNTYNSFNSFNHYNRNYNNNNNQYTKIENANFNENNQLNLFGNYSKNSNNTTNIIPPTANNKEYYPNNLVLSSKSNDMIYVNDTIIKIIIKLLMLKNTINVDNINLTENFKYKWEKDMSKILFDKIKKEEDYDVYFENLNDVLDELFSKTDLNILIKIKETSNVLYQNIEETPENSFLLDAINNINEYSLFYTEEIQQENNINF